MKVKQSLIHEQGSVKLANGEWPKSGAVGHRGPTLPEALTVAQVSAGVRRDYFVRRETVKDFDDVVHFSAEAERGARRTTILRSQHPRCPQLERCDLLGMSAGAPRHISATGFQSNRVCGFGETAMSWQSASSPWVKQMQRRIRMMRWVFIVACAVVLLALAGLFLVLRSVASTLASLSRSLPESTVPLSSSVFSFFAGYAAVAFMACVAFFFLHRWKTRRMRFICEHVPRHDGLVCPKCLEPVPETNAKSRCASCGGTYVLDQLRDFWEHYPYVQAFSDRRAFQAGASPDGTWQPAPPRAAYMRAIWMLLPFLLVIFVHAVASGRSVVTALANQFPVLLLAVAVAVGLVMHPSASRRSGAGRHCAVCNYQQAPNGAPPERCPECGTSWAGRGATVRGSRSSRPQALWIGGALVPAAVGLLMFMLENSRTTNYTLRIVPTTALLHDVANEQVLNDAAVAELTRRPLTSAERETLASALLDRRLQREGFFGPAAVWFASELAAGRLSQSIIERYQREKLKLWIEAPQDARVGESIHLSVGGEYRGRETPKPAAADGFYVAGFLVGEESQLLGRRARADYARSFDTTLPSKKRFDEAPHAECVARTPGPLRIRFVGWLVVDTKFTTGREIEWQPDGTPKIPNSAVWSERIEVETTVHVRD